MASSAARSIILLALLFPVFRPTTTPETFIVRINRPWKKGDRFRISASASYTKFVGFSAGLVMSSDNPDKLSADLVADATVLEIRSDGRIAKESLLIDRCTVSQRDRVKTNLRKGTSVIASVENDKAVFLINGQPPDDETTRAMSLVVPLSPQPTSEDQAFGTGLLKTAGDKWAVDSTASANWLRETGFDVGAAPLSGNGTLKKKLTMKGMDCVAVNFYLDVPKFSAVVNRTPVIGGRLQLHSTDVLPVDMQRPCLERSRQITIHWTITLSLSDARVGAPANIDNLIEIKSDAHATPE